MLPDRILTGIWKKREIGLIPKASEESWQNLSLIKEYLNNRVVTIKNDNVKATKTLTSKCPQGSILGRML